MTASAPKSGKSFPSSATGLIRCAPPNAGWAITGRPRSRTNSLKNGSPSSMGETSTASTPSSFRPPGLVQTGRGGADQVGHIERPAPGGVGCLGGRGEAHPHPVGERAIGVVREPVVVLDDVEPRQREGVAERRRLANGEAYRLQDRGGEGPAADSGELAQSGD